MNRRFANQITAGKKENLVAAMLQLHQKRWPLNINAVKRHSPAVLKAVYAIKPFWGWKLALEAAGLSYPDINIEVLEYCVCQWCGEERRHLGTHLLRAHASASGEYRRAFPTAEIVCESERVKLMRLSRPLWLPHWEPLWSPEYVLDRIAEYHRRAQPLNLGSVVRHDCGLVTHGKEAFGSWDKALTKAGIDPSRVRCLSKARPLSREEVIAALRERHARGESLGLASMAKAPLGKRATYIYKSAIRQFGSYLKAVRAAGIDPTGQLRVRPRHPRQERAALIAEARKVAALKGRARVAAARALHARFEMTALSRLFGSWTQVAKEAGVPMQRLSRRSYLNEELLLEWLAELVSQGVSVDEIFSGQRRTLIKGILHRFATLAIARERLERYLAQEGT